MAAESIAVARPLPDCAECAAVAAVLAPGFEYVCGTCGCELRRVSAADRARLVAGLATLPAGAVQVLPRGARAEIVEATSPAFVPFTARELDAIAADPTLTRAMFGEGAPAGARATAEVTARVAHGPSRVYRADLDAPPPARPISAPAAPFAPVASAPPEDPDLVRVRCLLAALQPRGVPLGSGTPEPSAPAVRVQGGGSMDADLPRGLGARPPEPSPEDRVTGRLAELRASRVQTDRDAAAVLDWLCRHGSLADGARALFAAAALQFASEDQARAWEDFGARWQGAPPYGRALVLASARAWWGE